MLDLRGLSHAVLGEQAAGAEVGAEAAREDAPLSLPSLPLRSVPKFVTRGVRHGRKVMSRGSSRYCMPPAPWGPVISRRPSQFCKMPTAQNLAPVLVMMSGL